MFPGHGVTQLTWVQNTPTPRHWVLGKNLASVAADIRALNGKMLWKKIYLNKISKVAGLDKDPN